MKDVSTGRTIPNDLDCPVTKASDWEAAVIKQAGVVVGLVKTRGRNRTATKEQVAVRYSPEVLAAFRAAGPGWKTRMNEALKDWLRTHSPT